ncbi:hypothetical protein AOCH_002848 [Aspergillus ochraceoroseus]|uniref:ER membrane protein complex subunit 7 beta-sandwich domain-containing protein n=1 Tax=Aspergillus ochraceoroseus TaxID=138278 RepID=A0A0F8WN42_9EURO|nr:hypothetical protein AOCH_002848 [Aspergillus ochraceoroseus]
MKLPSLYPSILLPLLFSLPTPAVSASSLKIVIPPSTLLPNPHSLPPGTHATLTSLSRPLDPSASSREQPTRKSILKAPLTRAASFVFDLALNAPAPATTNAAAQSSYLLDIRAPEYVFAAYRVDVSSEGELLGVWETFRGNAWENTGVEKFSSSSSSASTSESESESESESSRSASSADVIIIDAKVLGKKAFYEIRPKFSPLALFKNPMILLALVAWVDPEMRAEFEKQSRASPLSGAASGAMSAGGPANFDLAGWMAGQAAPAPAPAPASGAGAGDGEVAGSRGAASARDNRGAARRR